MVTDNLLGVDNMNVYSIYHFNGNIYTDYEEDSINDKTLKIQNDGKFVKAGKPLKVKADYKREILHNLEQDLIFLSRTQKAIGYKVMLIKIGQVPSN